VARRERRFESAQVPVTIAVRWDFWPMQARINAARLIVSCQKSTTRVTCEYVIEIHYSSDQ
jgi:hypothetical protein